jgi:citrate lyase subunit beta / citryl-CoA lyase
MPVYPRRSVLYVPGSNPRALEKAAITACDAVILDLEDAVAPDAKDAARADVIHACAKGFPGKEVLVRINAPDTPWYTADLEKVMATQADGLLAPKIRGLDGIDRLCADMNTRDPSGKIKLWLMIETPQAILHAPTIATALCRPEYVRVKGIVVGTNDLSKETGASLENGRKAVLPWLSTCILLARSAGLCAIDGVFNAIADTQGFVSECDQARALGFDGKTVIHPSQIDSANRIFAPSKADIEQAQRIIAAFARPEHAAQNVIRLDGRMVERLHEESARALLALDHAIRERHHGTAT